MEPPRMILVGDIHGKRYPFDLICEEFEKEDVIQLGDFGVGFSGEGTPTLPKNARFFRGNHDNPEVCRRTKGYMGDFGSSTFQHKGRTFPYFWVSGAWSIDAPMRIPGVSWWPDEELDAAACERAYEEYLRVKPVLMLSHDCPSSVGQALLDHLYVQPTPLRKTPTGQLLQAMWEAHQPRLWVHGHWHVRWGIRKGVTDFQCLEELGVLNTNRYPWFPPREDE